MVAVRRGDVLRPYVPKARQGRAASQGRAPDGLAPVIAFPARTSRVASSPQPGRRRGVRLRLRLAQLSLVVLALGMATLVGERLAAAAGGGPARALPCAPALPALPGGCPHLYQVKPGDTVWSLAVRFAGGADPRPLEDALVGELRGAVLQPGQLVEVP